MVGVVLPLILLGGTKITENLNGILAVNVLVIAGVLVNRLNVCIFGLYRFNAATGANYFPSWMEFIITLALVALAVFIFKMAAKYLQLFSAGAEPAH